MIKLNITRFGGRGASSSKTKAKSFKSVYTLDEHTNQYYKGELVGHIWYDRSNTKEKVIGRYMMSNRPISITKKQLENKTNQKIENLLLKNGYEKKYLVSEFRDGHDIYPEQYLYVKKRK